MTLQFAPATLALEEVRMYTDADPYYYIVDNRPLGDLDLNIKSSVEGVDASRRANLIETIGNSIVQDKLIGTGGTIAGLRATITSATQVTIGQGALLFRENLSPEVSGQLLKKAILFSNTIVNTPAPLTGAEVQHLIQVKAQNVENDSTFPYGDATNEFLPSSLLSSSLMVQVITGAEASLGLSVTPTPTSGWTPLYSVLKVGVSTPVLTAYNNGLRILKNFEDLLSPTGSSLVGFARGVLADSISQVGQMLNSLPVTIWEFASLVTSKPTPSVPSTWDWTPALAALLAHAEPRKVITPGTYLSGPLSIPTGTKLYMAGATVQALPTLNANTPLLMNVTIGGAEDTYYDRDIEIHGGVFKGNSGPRTNSLVAFLKAYNVQLNGTRVTGNQYMGISIGGCRHVIFNNIEIDLCGNPTVTTEGGAAVWIGTTSASRTYDVQFRSAHIHDNQWTGCYSNGTDVVFDSSCRLINNKEGGIFGNNTEAVNLKFLGTIDGVSKKNISASGIEYGGSGLQVCGATIQNTDNGCIDLTDASDFIITDSSFANSRRDPTTYPTGSAIVLLSTLASGSQVRRGIIKGNRFRDSSTPSYAGILVAGSGAVASSIEIEGNNLLGTTYTQGQIVIAAPQTGVAITRRNNLGTTDLDIKAGQFQLQLASGTQTVTGLGFRPRHLSLYTTGASATQVTMSQSNIAQSGSVVCGMYSSNDSSGRVGGPTTDSVHLVDGLSGVLARATNVVFTDDGFTITLPVTNLIQPFVNYVAYP